MPTTWVPAATSNYSTGREGTSLDRIVLHWIVGNQASADAVFKDGRRRVSAHYSIENDSIHQYVNEEDTAYHAGNWAMNLRSIGIEHAGGPTLPITEGTIRTSIQMVADLCRRHGIPCDREHIIKHQEIVATQCPGTLPIDRIVNEARALLSQPAPAPGPVVDLSQYIQYHVDPNQVKLQVGGQWYERQALNGIISDKAIADKKVAALTQQLADCKNDPTTPHTPPNSGEPALTLSQLRQLLSSVAQAILTALGR